MNRETLGTLGKWSYLDRVQFAIRQAKINSFPIVSVGIPQKIQNYIIQEMTFSTDHPKKKGKLQTILGEKVKITKKLQITTLI